MLPPSSIQNSAGNAGSPRSTQELARALTVDKPTPVTVRQVSASTSQSSQPWSVRNRDTGYPAG